MRCPKCFKKISDDSAFCSHCGAKIIKEIECPKCGAMNDVSSNFCKQCGSKLENPNDSPILENREPAKKHISSEGLKKSSFFVSMAMMILSMVLIMSLIFTPFLDSSFFPNNSFTIIGWLSNTFSDGLPALFDNYKYVDFIYAIILITLFVLIEVLSFIYLATSLSKFIKGLRISDYYDFSVKVSILYSLFLATYIFMIKFVLNNDAKYADSVGAGPLTVLIIVPIFLFLNSLVRDLVRLGKLNQNVIMRVCYRSILFIITMVCLSLIGGGKFDIFAQTGYGSIRNKNVGNLGLIDFVIGCPFYADIYPDTVSTLTVAIIFSVFAFLFEIVVLIISMKFIYRSFTSVYTSRPSYKEAIVNYIVIIALSIASFVFDVVVNNILNGFNILKGNGIVFNANLINISSFISTMILYGFIVITNSVMVSIDKK